MKRIPELDGVRGIAVLMVIFYHLIMALLPGGWLGVDIFFVLSGFLITSLLLNEYDRNGCINLKTFYWRRALRLLPAVTALLIVYLIWAIYSGTPWQRALQIVAAGQFYAANLTGFVDWPFDSRLLGHLWSLSVEEHFYFLWPLTFIALQKHIGKQRSIKIFLVCLITVIAIWRGWLYWYTGDFGRVHFVTDTRADSLLLGCLTAFIARSNRRVPHWLALLCIAPLVFYLSRHLLPPSPFLPFQYLVIAGSTGTLLLWISQNQTSPICSLLRLWPLVWFGQISYSLYLWQGPIIHAIRHLASGHWSKAYTPLTLLVAIFVAACSYYFIEKPFLSLKDHQSKRPKETAEYSPIHQIALTTHPPERANLPKF